MTAMRPHRSYLSETETWQVIAYLCGFHAPEGKRENDRK